MAVSSLFNYELERLYNVIETGEINLDELVPRIRELQGCQEQLQARRVEIENQMSDRKSMPVLPDKAAIAKEGVLPIVPYGGR